MNIKTVINIAKKYHLGTLLANMLPITVAILLYKYASHSWFDTYGLILMALSLIPYVIVYLCTAGFLNSENISIKLNEKLFNQNNKIKNS